MAANDEETQPVRPIEEHGEGAPPAVRPGEQRPVREREHDHPTTEAPARPHRAERREPPAPRKPWYRRPLPLLAAAVILVGILIVVGLWWWNSRKYVSTDDAFISGHIVRIAPRVAGRVLHVYIDDNQDVKAGQLMVEIDPADFQIRLEQAQAALGEAQGRLG